MKATTLNNCNKRQQSGRQRAWSGWRWCDVATTRLEDAPPRAWADMSSTCRRLAARQQAEDLLSLYPVFYYCDRVYHRGGVRSGGSALCSAIDRLQFMDSCSQFKCNCAAQEAELESNSQLKSNSKLKSKLEPQLRQHELATPPHNGPQLEKPKTRHTQRFGNWKIIFMALAVAVPGSSWTWSWPRSSRCGL